MAATNTLHRIRPIIAGVSVFLLAATLSGLLVWQLERHSIEDDRLRVTRVAVEHGHAIEVTIQHALAATQSLATLVRQGKGKVPNFDTVSSTMLPFYPGASELALAPGGIVREVAPVHGNEMVIGLDLLTDPEQRKESLLARSSGQLTLAGPLELVQGGTGVVGRLPVFIEDSRGHAIFWGFTLVMMRLPGVLDMDHLSRLDEQGLAYELWRIHPDSGQKQLITQSLSADLIEPVEQAVRVPNASWTLSVAPVKGWGSLPGLSLKLALALLVSLMLAYLAKLFVELRRQKQLLDVRVADRTAEILLAKSKLQATLNAIPDLVWLKDADGVYLSCNPTFGRFFGASEAEIIGKTDYDFVDGAQADFFREHDRMAMAAGKPSTNEEWLTFADDGSRRLVETIKTPMLDGAGLPNGVLGIARDITARVQVERALVESRQQAQQYLNIVGVMLIAVDTQGRIQLINRKGCDMLGTSEADILGKDCFEDFMPERIRNDVRETFIELLQDNAAPVEYMESAILTRSGEERVVAWHITLLRDDAGKINGVLASGEDITERKRAEQSLRDSRASLRLLLDSMAEAAYGVDINGNCTFVNRAFLKMLGYQNENEVLGIHSHKLIHHSHADGKLYPASECRMYRAYRLNQAINIADEVVWRKDGVAIPVEYWANPIVTDGVVAGAIVTFVDITERKRYIAELEHQALYDSLTDLPNRTLFADRLTLALAIAQRETQPLAIILLNIARLKEVNDTVGHHNGDIVLQEVARRITMALRKTDTVARLSGDEFAILLPGAGKESVTFTIETIQKAMEAPAMIDDGPLDIEVYMGVAIYPQHGEDATVLLSRADVAMRMAKNEVSGFFIYDFSRDPYSRRRLSLLGELRQAIAQDELVLYYQPQIDIASSKVMGVEALVRWPRTADDMVSPEEFIPLAEQTGLIRPLTLWVLEQAVQQYERWRTEGFKLKISVNLSARNLLDPTMPDMLEKILAARQVTSDGLVLEVTESAVMLHPERALKILTQLQAMGASLSVDDFGTGYSSLAYLKKLPVCELKIDQSFVFGMVKNESDAIIVRSTIDLAHNLGLKVVAEGVEDQETLQLLASLGCDIGQGYFFARPMPAEEFGRWLSESPWGFPLEV